MNENISADMFEIVSNTTIQDAQIEGEAIGFFKDAWLRFKQNKAAIVGAVIIIAIVFMAIFGPMFSKHGYRDQHTSFGALPPRIPILEDFGICDGSIEMDLFEADLETYGDAIMRIKEEYIFTFKGKEIPKVIADVNAYTLREAEDYYFVFGTDDIGRDLFVRLWRGTRISLLIGVVSVIINCIIGVVYGSISGYYGGTIDMILQRITEILGSVPFLVMSILFIMVLGAGVASFILVLVLTGWIGMSRMIRAQFYRYKGYEYVMAARTMGVSDFTIIFRHILPNAIGPIITQATFAVPAAIFSEAFLSYLGLGVQAPEPSIGVLLSEGQKVLTTTPHLTLFPALIVSALMLAFNMFGNGLRDAFDPRMRGL
ncbi:peptide ABC transporter permease [Candidatus Epulonipiscium fishelsonii]|uniref:Peptide ABC transporter permease n=1 Tax=Candidatus Epulonipiscium fishelsonii TaxID=77094 RepID=A0ACC8XEH9_9FIRM|nr:peptide ABC transporter permease [Epulopiscium sp. SCG-B05WGA-EpuloA1]ONI41254.1 peptide ABC transporter permease [Epulopiscium sp. SCG-B11WGA-EpuloA1]